NMSQRWQQEAGWVLVDPSLHWVVSKASILSQGKNTPLIGQQLTGKVIGVFA
ncbi:MAG: aspartate carbamoyltransferase, partial [Acinetobacter sp.]